jgi:hypothetical protein
MAERGQNSLKVDVHDVGGNILSLESSKIEHLHLTGAQLDTINLPKELRALWLENCSGTDLLSLHGLQNLHLLSIRSCHLTCSTISVPASIRALRCEGLSDLITLDLHATTALEWLMIQRCPLLEEVSLGAAHTALTRVVLFHLTRFQSTERLLELPALQELMAVELPATTAWLDRLVALPHVVKVLPGLRNILFDITLAKCGSKGIDTYYGSKHERQRIHIGNDWFDLS